MESELPLPSHVEEAVEAISAMQVVHAREATRAERLVDKITSLVGKPLFLLLVVSVLCAWVLAGSLFGKTWPDSYPFPALGIILSGSGVCIAILILAS